MIRGTIAVTPFAVPANPRAPPHERASRAAIKIETVLSPVTAKLAGDFVSPVVTSFGFADAKRRKLWSTDGKPAVSETFDPLLAYVPGSAHSFPYGGSIMTGKPSVTLTDAGGLVQPALTILDEDFGFGLTVALSPEDKTVYSRLNVSTSSTYAFDRYQERFGAADVNLTTMLYLHEPDWRPALAAVRDTWPAFVYPNETVATPSFDGLMAYADYRGDEAAGGPTAGTAIPFETLRAMGTKVNWDASFPFMGTPFVGEGGISGPFDENWTTCYCHPDNPVSSNGPRACRKNSWKAMESAYQELQSKAGVSTLAYGNMYMFGYKIQPFKMWESSSIFSSACDPPSTDDYQRSNCSLNMEFGKWRDAAMFDPATGEQMLYPYGDYGLAIVDPGEPKWQAHMAAFHLKQTLKTPSLVGVALDEQQYLGSMNAKRDDGIGWYTGKPAASLLVSFITASAAIARTALHPSGRGLLVNPHVTRLDMFRELDGILDEFGDAPTKMMTSGIAGLAMPVLAWDHCHSSKAKQKTAASCATDNSTFDQHLG
jgi:hypothetical protein